MTQQGVLEKTLNLAQNLQNAISQNISQSEKAFHHKM